MRKFFQVVRDEEHVGFFKHRAASDERARAVRAAHDRGVVLVLECRLGQWAFRREVLRLEPSVRQRLVTSPPPSDDDEHDCCAPSYGELVAELASVERGRLIWQNDALKLRLAMQQIFEQPEQASDIALAQIGRRASK